MSDTITRPSAAEQQRLEFQREVLRQLEDTTNQTWASKRKRWARLVRAQAEEIDRLRAALEQPEPSDPGSVPVKRSRMEALSKALGHPTQLAVADGDTAEDALVELAASRLEQPQKEPVADRAAFERHAESLGYSVDPDTRAGREGGYWSSHTHLMWETWQAALEQPEQDTDCHAQGICQRTGYGIGRPDQKLVAYACFKNGELQTELVGTEADVNFWCASDEPEMQGMVKGALYTHPPRRETEQPEQEPGGVCARCGGWVCDPVIPQPEQEPVAYLYHDAQSAHDANPMLHSTLLVMATERRPEYRNETPLYTHPPRREPITVTDLQQALVDADLVDPDAIDDPEGFDNGFTLQQIDALHSRLMQTTLPTTTPQPEPK